MMAHLLEEIQKEDGVGSLSVGREVDGQLVRQQAVRRELAHNLRVAVGGEQSNE